jgi:xylulose-5-phosphate/fructose-6-phosphate phosphoketolase
MPGEVIDRPNPEPSASNVPDQVLDLAVKVSKDPLPEDAASSLKEFRRAACYIAAGTYPNSLKRSRFADKA